MTEKLTTKEQRQKNVEKTTRYRLNNPDKIKEYRKLYYIKNREKLLKKARKDQLRQRYGMTELAYSELFNKQDGKCAICYSIDSNNLSVDHCHSTGDIRGLLCNNCNRGIGLLKDSPSVILKAYEYLQNYKERKLNDPV